MNKQQHIDFICRTVEQDLPKAQQLIRLAELAMDHARKCGASDSVISLSIDQGLSLAVRKGEIETVEHTGDRGLSITVYRGHHKGDASTADFTESAIKQVVEKACDIAHYTEEDLCLGLVDKELHAAEFVEFDHWHPLRHELDELVEITTRCEQAGLDYHSDITNTEGANLTTQSGLTLLANSRGFIGFKAGTGHSLSCVLVAGTDNSMQRDYWYDHSRDGGFLNDPEIIGKKAAERTIARLGARQAPTGAVPILFAPEMARGLIGNLVSAVAGSNQFRKTSFLLDSIGTQVISDSISLIEQPHLLDGLRSSSFDAEGVATHKKHLVKDGQLQNYVLGSYSARKLGLQTTANAGGLYNLSVDSRTENFDSLLKKMGNGLFVTEFMGQGVNMLTGDYSRGASGFWVENGAISYPVQEVTVAGNLQEMLMNIKAVGDDVDTRSSTRTGSILVGEMMVSGK